MFFCRWRSYLFHITPMRWIFWFFTLRIQHSFTSMSTIAIYWYYMPIFFHHSRICLFVVKCSTSNLKSTACQHCYLDFVTIILLDLHKLSNLFFITVCIISVLTRIHDHKPKHFDFRPGFVMLFPFVLYINIHAMPTAIEHWLVSNGRWLIESKWFCLVLLLFVLIEIGCTVF